jgi:hypothetical protein
VIATKCDVTSIAWAIACESFSPLPTAQAFASPFAGRFFRSQLGYLDGLPSFPAAWVTVFGFVRAP